jgi:uncharacterized protein
MEETDHRAAAEKSFAFTPAIRADMANAVLCWLATVGEDGVPNVSPKETFCAHGDDALLIANIASPQSRRNIAANPQVCVSFVDVFRQCGFKLIGEAHIVAAATPEFDAIIAPLILKAGPDFKVLDVFVVTIRKAARILAPSYRLFPDRTSEEHIRRTQRTYGVRPAD